MGWTWPDNQEKPITKYKGECRRRQQQQICPYWMAKHSISTKAVIGFKCALFDLDKSGSNSLPICNSTYGRSYEGKP